MWVLTCWISWNMSAIQQFHDFQVTLDRAQQSLWCCCFFTLKLELRRHAWAALRPTFYRKVRVVLYINSISVLFQLFCTTRAQSSIQRAQTAQTALLCLEFRSFLTIDFPCSLVFYGPLRVVDSCLGMCERYSNLLFLGSLFCQSARFCVPFASTVGCNPQHSYFTLYPMAQLHNLPDPVLRVFPVVVWQSFLQ